MADVVNRSESNLLVFISSRQTPNMEYARSEATTAVDAFPNCSVWAFENMPASSQKARDYYLSNATKADFVIWLVGEDTTQPVVEEIHACISVRGKLLAFLLPADSRDQVTNGLMGEVGDYAKWCDVGSLDDLGELVRSALSDEINRLFRSSLPGGRDQVLSEFQQESIARCKKSLTTLGVTDDMADELAQDSTVGYGLASPSSGVNRVVGDQGVGKTLAVERLYQKAISKALADRSQPFPVFVRARDLNQPVRRYVETVVSGYAFPAVEGAFVVVDGLDEVGTEIANRVLDDLEVYALANPKVTMVVTNRPLPTLKDVGYEIKVPRLEDPDLLALMSKVARRKVERNELLHLPQSVQSVANLPLFAIMIGSELGRVPAISWAMPTQLMSRMADRALREMGTQQDDVADLLQKLAVASVNNGSSVDKVELHPRQSMRNLLANSRLVNEQGGRVDFALPVFREWFAARAIVEGQISLDDLKPVSDRWLIPIGIAIHAENEAVGLSLAANLAFSDPGLAGQVFEEAERSWFTPDANNQELQGTNLEIGEAIRSAMGDWSNGLGQLMQKIGPVKPNSEVRTLGIEVGSRMIHTSWYYGSEALEPVVDLPRNAGFGSGKFNPDWPSASSVVKPPARVGPWIMTKKMLTDSLSESLKSRRLALASIGAVQELAYEFACNFSARGFSTPESADIREVVDYMDRGLSDVFSLHVNGSTYRYDELQAIRSQLAEMLHGGEVSIVNPWPGTDKTFPTERSAWMWDEEFTDQRLLDRTTAIFGAALRIYTDMVDTWFHCFGDRLRLKAILPVKLEGRLVIPPSPRASFDGPVLTWWPRAISEHEQSRVDFELGARDDDTQSLIRDMVEIARLEALKNTGVFWHSTGLLYQDGKRPATELAHRWLISDLKDIGWTDSIA